MDLWVQIYELRAGFMTEKVVKEVGNYINTFVSSCAGNFTGVWREFLRVKVIINMSKPLKRRMKVRKLEMNGIGLHSNMKMFPRFVLYTD